MEEIELGLVDTFMGTFMTTMAGWFILVALGRSLVPLRIEKKKARAPGELP